MTEKMLKNSLPYIFLMLLNMTISYYGTITTLNFSGLPPPKPPINALTYFLLCFISPITIFSIFSFSSPKSKFNKLILISSMLSIFLFPLIISNKYSLSFHVPIALFSFICSCKMFIWLKNSLNDKNSKKPFIWTLFNWRPKEGNIPIIKQQDLLEKGIESNNLMLYINYHYKRCFSVWLLYICCAQFSESFAPNVPDTPYPIRIIKFFYDGTPFTSLFNLFYCYIYASALFFSMNYLYEMIIISSAHLLFYIYSTPNSLLHIMLTKDQLDSLKLWLISFLFYTKPMFNHPYFSRNPIELWSIRWHQMFHEFFVELGFKPICYILNSFTSIKLQKSFGTLAAFFVSGILHEYILYSSSNYFTLEQLTYFLFNAIVMIIFKFFKKIEKIDEESSWKKIRNILFMTFFVLFSLPWFIEPYIRCEHYHSLMHFICKKKFF